MSFWSKIKRTAGDSQLVIPTIPSATSLIINSFSNDFFVTGTTAITNINTTAAGINPGRTITLLGATATGPAITDTAATLTGTNGTIALSAALSLALGSTVTLKQQNSGQWWEIARAVNG